MKELEPCTVVVQSCPAVQFSRSSDRGVVRAVQEEAGNEQEELPPAFDVDEVRCGGSDSLQCNAKGVLIRGLEAAGDGLERAGPGAKGVAKVNGVKAGEAPGKRGRGCGCGSRCDSRVGGVRVCAARPVRVDHGLGAGGLAWSATAATGMATGGWEWRDCEGGSWVRGRWGGGVGGRGG